MAYTLALDVNIGDYTKASNYDTLSDNADYLQVLADVQHDFNISTGTGYHKAITQLITDAAGATVKDLLTSEWDPASGSATIGQAIRLILAKMPDSAGNQDIYAALRTISDTVTSTSEEGRVVLAVMAAGTLTDQIEILKNAVRPTTDSALTVGSAAKRLLGVCTDTIGDDGQALGVAAPNLNFTATIPAGTARDIPVFFRAATSIADDGVATLFSGRTTLGMFLLHAVNAGGGSGVGGCVVSARCSTSPSGTIISQGGSFTWAIGTSDLAGTTGVDGQVTISCRDGLLEIENRISDPIHITLMALATT